MVKFDPNGWERFDLEKELKKKTQTIGKLVLLVLFLLPSIVIGMNLYGNITLNSAYTIDLMGVSGSVSFPSFSYVYDYQMRKDEMVNPFYGYMTLGHYWYINDSYFLFSLTDTDLRAKMGRMHFVEGPGKFYHLFLSDSAGPFNGLSLRYTPNSFFTFKQDMILLNDVNPRSLYYRKFTIHPLKGLSLSYEESILFMREFDPWYALVMLPYPAIQVFRQEDPKSSWYQDINDNALVGFSANYDFDRSKIYLEFLADDLDMNAIFAPNKFQNPNKLAWLVGGKTKLWNASITAEYAGATAYTFEKSPTTPASYAYIAYPKYNEVDGNMLGYKYGEDNDALEIRIEYPMNFGKLFTTYEHVRLGSRTPTVPWHGLSHVPHGTHWLDDPVTETRNTIDVGMQMKWQNLEFDSTLSYENIQNAELKEGVNTNNLSVSMSLGYDF